MICISPHSLSLLLILFVFEIYAQNGDEATPGPMPNGKVSRPCRHTTTSGQMTFPTLPPIRTPPSKPLTPPRPVSGNSGDRDPGPLNSGTGHNGGGPTTTDAPGPVPGDGHAPFNSEEDNHSPISNNDVPEGRKKRQLPAPPPAQVPLTTGTPGMTPGLLTLLCTPTTAVPPIPGVPGVTNGPTVPGGASLPTTPPRSIPGELPKGLTGEIPVTTPNPLVPGVTPPLGLTTPLNVPGIPPIPPQPPVVG